MTAVRARNALLASGGRRRVRSTAVAAAHLRASPPPALKNGGTLTIGLAEDPDALDPTLARTFVGRMIFMHMCEKLYDIDSHLNIVPQLAAAMPKFSDEQEDGDDQAADRPQVQRRHDARRGRGQAVARPAQDAGPLGTRERARTRHVDRHAGQQHGDPAPDQPVRADHGPARGSLRHGHVAEGAERPRRELRDEPGLRRPVHVQGPPGRRPHHARQVAVLLREEQGPPRPDHVQDHHRPVGAVAEPARARRSTSRTASRRRSCRGSRTTRACASSSRSRSATRASRSTSGTRTGSTRPTRTSARRSRSRPTSGRRSSSRSTAS